MAGKSPNEKPYLLWAGVSIIILAIVLSSMAYKKISASKNNPSLKGILLALLAGLAISFFYGFVVKSLDANYVDGGTGNLTPFTAIVIFSLGVFASTFLFNPFFMRYPVSGQAVNMKLYFKGKFREHFAGFVGGIIWLLGMVFSFLATRAANPAVAYALSNGAPVVAFLWGLFVWKEFKDAPKGTSKLLIVMFASYIIGLVLITMSHN
jgi:glucose uptake protein